MADASDSKSDIGNNVWVQVPFPAVERMKSRSRDLLFFVLVAEKSLEPKVQGFLTPFPAIEGVLGSPKAWL